MSIVLAQIKAAAPAELITLWLRHDAAEWRSMPEIYLLAGERLLNSGEVLLAYDILTEGLQCFPEAASPVRLSKKEFRIYFRMRQQRALALAQSGADGLALQELLILKKQDAYNPETLGLLGRTLKDAGLKTTNRKTGLGHLRAAYTVYSDAYAIATKKRHMEDAYYNGINAATLSLLIGGRGRSRALAEQVWGICTKILNSSRRTADAENYWLPATLGEAALLLGNLDDAQHWYAEAGACAQKMVRVLASMRRQARLVLTGLDKDPSLLDACFPVPSVAVFAGHMIDRPDRPSKRFPPELEKPIRNRIAACLEKSRAGISYSSAACGADIIFLEEMLKRGGELYVALPFEKELFRETSVDIIPGASWSERFDKVLRKAKEVRILCQHDRVLNMLNFEFANFFLYGAAHARARSIDSEVKPIAVWDGRPGDGPGGTASVVAHWRKQGQVFEHINPLVFTGGAYQVKKKVRHGKEKKARYGSLAYHTYLPMMFSDVKGYSKLDDEQLARFSVHFLKLVKNIIRKYDTGIMSRRTQGDGVFIVFRNIKAAVGFSVSLRDGISSTDWTRYGLPADLTARISLDAGPCYSYLDPVTMHRDFCGEYVIRAARIEPITPPGHIYASESFVALSYAMSTKNISFDYAGQVMLPKAFGTIPAYYVRSV